MASYNELAGYAKWMGGRIPTIEEVRSLYEYVEDRKSKQLEKSIGKIIPAVNSHLVNDGVEETPPSNGTHPHSSNTAASGLSSSDLFVNLQDANVGFKNWHPVPVTAFGRLAGQGETGGVWEWTSTVLEKHEGFEPMELYPGYTGQSFFFPFLIEFLGLRELPADKGCPKRTSLMENIILCLAVLGPLIPELLVANPCK
jgi:formylglycine-generating enzyme required for sulfatase activity